MLLPDLGGGGAQRVMLALSRVLDRTKFDLHLIAIGKASELAGDLPPDISVRRLDAPRLRSALPALIAALRRLKPDIVISTLGYINLGLLAMRPLLGDMRLIVREANVVSATLRSLPSFLPARRLYALLYPRASAIIAQTGAIASEIAAVAPRAKDRIEILPNPVDEDGQRARAARAVRAAGPGLVLAAAGRLTHQKGFDRLIGLMADLPADSRLTIYGEGPERQALQSQIDRQGLGARVSLPGFSSNLASEIAGADVFVLPSRWEGLPNVVLEALSLGTPVVASVESGVEEIAALAGAGAVSIAGLGPEFSAAILSHRPAPVTAPRSSLLPAEFRIENIGRRFDDLLMRIARTT